MVAIFDQIREFGIIPVVTIDRVEDAEPLAAALLLGGLGCVEITFRTAQAREAIECIASKYPQFLIGAGTVLSVEQAKRAVDAGARFIVSPGIDRKVVNWCISGEIPVVPGVATPTEILSALSFGLDVLKFFPAEAFGGIKTLKAFGAPFPNIRFIPTGGVNKENVSKYISLPTVLAVGGSWIVERSLIHERKFNEISTLTLETRELIQEVRNSGV